MAIVRTIIDKLMTRVVGRDEYRSLGLRRYFARQYGIKVGLYTIGAFDRWRIPPNSTVGRYGSIAKTARIVDGNHPVASLSTHPYFYLKQFGVVAADHAVVQAPIVEDDVWLGHGCIVMPGCHRIGRGAVVGAGAIVMKDVPPYAIMSGNPAKLVRYRFAPEAIEAIEATQWWLLDKPALEEALRKAPDFALSPSVETANQFLRALGRPELRPSVVVPLAAEPAVGGPSAASATASILELLQREAPAIVIEDFTRPLADLEVDSFALINLRIALEALIGRQIPDRNWGRVRTPADLVEIASAGGEAQLLRAVAAKADGGPVVISNEPQVSGAAAERRIQYVNMPQMALSGLAEPWLFKEIGDMHWSVLTRGLRTPSAGVADSEGDRLYATFTRICLSSTQPLTDFTENDRLTLDLQMERFGAGMFFSAASVKGSTGQADARIMTSFSKFGESGSNTSLLKGQPVIPDGCEIAPIEAMPAFAHEYRAQRAQDLPPALFECEYELIPPHDINGVGLLYFAAYPTVIDICAMKHFGPTLFSDFSTTYRDVYYFANCGPDETLVFRIHKSEATADRIKFDATLSRKSDAKVMAFVATMKSPKTKR